MHKPFLFLKNFIKIKKYIEKQKIKAQIYRIKKM